MQACWLLFSLQERPETQQESFLNMVNACEQLLRTDSAKQEDFLKDYKKSVLTAASDVQDAQALLHGKVIATTVPETVRMPILSVCFCLAKSDTLCICRNTFMQSSNSDAYVQAKYSNYK